MAKSQVMSGRVEYYVNLINKEEYMNGEGDHIYIYIYRIEEKKRIKVESKSGDFNTTGPAFFVCLVLCCRVNLCRFGSLSNSSWVLCVLVLPLLYITILLLPSSFNFISSFPSFSKIINYKFYQHSITMRLIKLGLIKI